MATINVGMMTSGGLAPCLSSAIAHLIHYWAEAKKTGKIAGLTIRMYRDGYKGMLTGDSFVVPEDIWDQCSALHDLGGSPIGNSRVKVCLNESIYRQRFILCSFSVRIYIYSQVLLTGLLNLLS